MLLTRAALDDDCQAFEKIILTGKTDPAAGDNYSKNYRFIQKFINEKAESNPKEFRSFIGNLRRKTCFLTVTTENRALALRVFNTLNNRGLPLSDADIFKSDIYGRLGGGEEQKAFIDSWNLLVEKSEVAGIDVQRLFMYLMYYDKACSDDASTSVKSVGEYFEDKIRKVDYKELMTTLHRISDLLVHVSNLNASLREVDDSTSWRWQRDLDVAKALDVLRSYPNEYWRYAVISYLLANEGRETFRQDFVKFLRKLASLLIVKFMEWPSLMAIKSVVLKLNIASVSSTMPEFKFNPQPLDTLAERFYQPHSKLVSMLLKYLAYANPEQKELLPEDWQIEHILPKKWKGICTEPEETINLVIENIGNKLLLNKKLNIKASNNYFGIKKEYYLKSGIADAIDLGNSISDTWGSSNIKHRDANLFIKFKSEYGKACEE